MPDPRDILFPGVSVMPPEAAANSMDPSQEDEIVRFLTGGPQAIYDKQMAGLQGSGKTGILKKILLGLGEAATGFTHQPSISGRIWDQAETQYRNTAGNLQRELSASRTARLKEQELNQKFFKTIQDLRLQGERGQREAVKLEQEWAKTKQGDRKLDILNKATDSTIALNEAKTAQVLAENRNMEAYGGKTSPPGIQTARILQDNPNLLNPMARGSVAANMGGIVGKLMGGGGSQSTSTNISQRPFKQTVNGVEETVFLDMVNRNVRQSGGDNEFTRQMRNQLMQFLPGGSGVNTELIPGQKRETEVPYFQTPKVEPKLPIRTPKPPGTAQSILKSSETPTNWKEEAFAMLPEERQRKKGLRLRPVPTKATAQRWQDRRQLNDRLGAIPVILSEIEKLVNEKNLTVDQVLKSEGGIGKWRSGIVKPLKELKGYNGPLFSLLNQFASRQYMGEVLDITGKQSNMTELNNIKSFALTTDTDENGFLRKMLRLHLWNKLFQFRDGDGVRSAGMNMDGSQFVRPTEGDFDGLYGDRAAQTINNEVEDIMRQLGLDRKTQGWKKPQRSITDKTFDIERIFAPALDRIKRNYEKRKNNADK